MDIRAELMGLESDLTQVMHYVYRAQILISKATEETVIFPWEQENPTETMQTQQQKELKRVLLETADEDLSMANDLAKDLFDKFETLVEALNDTAESIKEI